MSKILSVLVLVLVACGGEKERAEATVAASACPVTTVATYIVHDVVGIDEKCQGVLPLLSNITLYDSGMAFVEGISDTGTIALWKKSGPNLVVEYLSVAGWRATMDLAPAGTSYKGKVEWWNPITNGFCKNWQIELHL